MTQVTVCFSGEMSRSATDLHSRSAKDSLLYSMTEILVSVSCGEPTWTREPGERPIFPEALDKDFIWTAYPPSQEAGDRPASF
jgi:hypothetical protein